MGSVNHTPEKLIHYVPSITFRILINTTGLCFCFVCFVSGHLRLCQMLKESTSKCLCMVSMTSKVLSEKDGKKIQQEKPKPLVSARWFLCASYLIFHREVPCG